MAAGCAAAAFATAFPGIATATAAALLLGAGYGICLIVGLREVEEIAAPGQLGAVIALFYSLAYSGLAVPYLLALVAPTTGYPQALLFTAAAATLTLAAVFFTGLRSSRARPELKECKPAKVATLPQPSSGHAVGDPPRHDHGHTATNTKDATATNKDGPPQGP